MPEVAAALAEVDPKNIRRIDSTLVSFGTRNTFSDTTSTTHGIGAARRWIYSEFQRYSQACGGCLRVEYNEKVQMVGRTNPIQANIVNVLGVVAGSRHEPRRRDERTLRLVRLRQPQRHERLDRPPRPAPTTTAPAARR